MCVFLYSCRHWHSCRFAWRLESANDVKLWYLTSSIQVDTDDACAERRDGGDYYIMMMMMMKKNNCKKKKRRINKMMI